MLPRLKTAQEKKNFAEKLYSIFMGQDSINKYMNASGKEREEWQAMHGAELIPHLEAEEGPANGIVNLTEKCTTILDSLKGITSGILNDEAFEKNWNKLDEALELANNKNDPFKPVNDYLDKFGMKKLNNPIIKLHMEMAQAISNSVNYSLLSTNPFNVEIDQKYVKSVKDNQKIIDDTSKELAKLCADNSVSTDFIYGSYNAAKEKIDELKKDIKETVEKSSNISPENAQKIADYLTADDHLIKVQRELHQISSKCDPKAAETLQSAAQIAEFYDELRDKKDQPYNDKRQLQAYEKRIQDQAEVVSEHESWIRNFEREMPEEQIKTYSLQNDAAVKLKSSLKTFKKLAKFDNLNQLIQDFKDGKDVEGLNSIERKMLSDYETAKDTIKDAYINSETKHTEDLEDFFERLENPKEHANVCDVICKNEDNPIQHRINFLDRNMKVMQDQMPHLENYVRERRELNAENIKLDNLIQGKERLEESISQKNGIEKLYKDALTNYRMLAKRNMEKFNIGKWEDPSADDLDPKNSDKLVETINQTQNKLIPKYNDLVANEKECKAALDAAKNGLKGVDLPATYAKDLGEKIKQVNQTSDRLRTLSQCVKKADTIVNAIEQKSIAQSGRAYETQIKIETQRRNAISDTLKGYMQTHLSEGNPKKNSDAYNDLRKNLKEVAEAFSENSTLSNSERGAKIANLRSAAEKYLQEKGKQWRPFPSAQRLSRLQGAENVLKFCNDMEAAVKETRDIDLNECKEKSKSIILNTDTAKKQMEATIKTKVNKIKQAEEQAKMKKAPAQNKENTVASTIK